MNLKRKKEKQEATKQWQNEQGITSRQIINTMDYQGVLEYLKDIEAGGIHLGLENTRQILDRFSKDPDTDFRGIDFIQVAGTNGKGSTAHFLASILQSAGYRVGLFTSPHVEDIRERITINKQWISEEDFSTGLWSVKDLSENLLKGGLISRAPTYFEHIFLTALHYFSRARVDIAILEVGLGGRWDATSTITPGVSVITNIAKDHTAMLGTRIRDIAGEKAGIIKRRIPVVCGCRVGSIAHRVIKTIAAQNNALFYNVLDSKNQLDIHRNNHFYRCRYTTESGDYAFEVRLNGVHQAFNAAAAIKTLQVLGNTRHSISVPRASIGEGISNTFIPARIEILDTSPPIILDASHNVESTAVLTHFLKEKGRSGLTLVFGVLADKNYRKMISLLLPYIHRVILTEPLSGRALPAQKMLKFFNHKEVILRKKLEEAYHAARQFKGDILVTGSFYLVGAIRKIILAGG
ncbi:MAG: bifunctional folylpolyglutamate synthase/dihydrofolate synthase [Candidatus Aminicenantes bacterium]|nr:MAG: bifunctional folylpolyglutamate synthase/dihydrofolate synthase [Candidatus Aminicenantes bacterium]